MTNDVRAASPGVEATLDLRLWNAATESDAACADPALRTILTWLRSEIIQPHPHLGRAGAVCPFVQPSLQLRCLWMAALNGTRTAEELCYAIGYLLHIYDSHQPDVGANSGLRTFVVVLPDLNGPEAPALIDQVHATMKPAVVARGLMLGEFYPASTSPGVHNPAFRPLRSPLALFVLRHMVPGDLILLNKRSDPPQRRGMYLRAYLKAMAPELSIERFGEAKRALIAADAEAHALRVGAP